MFYHHKMLLGRKMLLKFSTQFAALYNNTSKPDLAHLGYFLRYAPSNTAPALDVANSFQCLKVYKVYKKP